MGRIKEISRKSAHTRKRNPVVYLICEGSETEIRYFKRFRSRGCNIDIIPISSQYKSADRLVQKAKATMGLSLIHIWFHAAFRTFGCGRVRRPAFLAGNGRIVLNRRFINLIIVVDDLPFGIADFLTADVAVFFQ